MEQLMLCRESQPQLGTMPPVLVVLSGSINSASLGNP